MDKIKRELELLAPAGNFEKLKTALYFGADAVYLGGKDFSLRSFSDNFTQDEMKNGVALAHEKGKKVFVTANIFAKNSDFSALSDYFKFLYEIGVDAVLITDAGVLSLAKSVAPNLKIHLSTQANTTNKYSAKFWYEQGVERVVLARELSIAEISEIRDFCPQLQLEAFVHGAMCISYSGRCLISNYLAGRDSNRGECVQACRWNYQVSANGKDYHPVEEDEKGTYIFNSKDLNLINQLKELINAGVDSFKIEGRMKSSYYLATVVNAYRRAIDKLQGKNSDFTDEEIYTELKKCAHRDFTTAYALGENSQTVNYNDSQTKGSCEYIANVLETNDSFSIVEMRNRFKIGDTLEILSPSNNCNKKFILQEMYDEKGCAVQDAKLVQQRLKITSPYKLSEGDILRRPQ